MTAPKIANEFTIKWYDRFMKYALKKLIPENIFSALEPKYHLMQAIVAAAKNGSPAKKMKFIGVTGTNGKTSTCFMIHKILVESGIKTGLMTTVAYGIDNDIVDQKEHVTTLSAPLLQEKLAEFARKGVEWVVLETTSHALAQHRVYGIDYTVAVITNITHEHLDYHKTFQNYTAAKAKLLKNAQKNNGVLIINADDPVSAKVSEKLHGVTTYGINNGDVRATKINLLSGMSIYETKIDGKRLKIRCNLPGEFNVYNSLAACLAAKAAGVSLEMIPPALMRLKKIKGRMEVIHAGQKFSAIVDFAHTPDSFERLLSGLSKTTKGKLIVLFGSAGRRDEAKRFIQGEIAGRYADEVILTEEDDRDIDGNEILDCIAMGAEKSGKVKGDTLFLIPDRTKAIEFAVTRAKSMDDVVIFLGKGHEKTIERADGVHSWDEVSTVKKALRRVC